VPSSVCPAAGGRKKGPAEVGPEKNPSGALCETPRPAGHDGPGLGHDATG
jgi:hypothetical protein